MTPELPEEPPVGAVVLDCDGRPWLRIEHCVFSWHGLHGTGAREWPELVRGFGPLTLLVPQPEAQVAAENAYQRGREEMRPKLREAEDRAEAAHQRIALARQALVDTGHFTPGQVGDDIAPRIVEMFSALVPQPATPEPRVRGNSALRMEIERLRAELGHIREQSRRYGAPCPTCQGRNRHTIDMVCMTCGRDYMPDDGSDESAPGLGWKRLLGLWREQAKQAEAKLFTAETKVREYAAALADARCACGGQHYCQSELADARAQALEEAATALEGTLGVAGCPQEPYEFRRWLRDRAAAIRADLPADEVT